MGVISCLGSTAKKERERERERKGQIRGTEIEICPAAGGGWERHAVQKVSLTMS